LAFKDKRLKAALAALGTGFALAAAPAGAPAAPGGIAAPGSIPAAPPSGLPTPTACSVGGGGIGSASSCGPTGKATLLPTGLAVAPVDAPRPVKRAVRWANQIIDKPYRLGGGHKLGWRMDTAYDCSGTVSWALRGARLLKAPVPSGSFSRWGAPGLGRWITVYYNAGHAYAVIAGLRLDTSMVAGNGPGWSTKMRSSAGYKSRYAPGL
jgi:cell wall-associated NlpC family hydrolase